MATTDKLLKFDDVTKCQDVTSLNDFIAQYLAERHLKGEAAHRTYWALFFAWRDSLWLRLRKVEF